LINIAVPKMGMGTTEVEIIKWVVKKGDSVKPGDPIVEIETEKVSYTIESEVLGAIDEILYKEGDSVPIGKVLCRIKEGR